MPRRKYVTYRLKFVNSFRFTSISLSNLNDSLSEICSKICRDKNWKSKRQFKGLKNNKLSYNYKECRKKNKKQLKPINRLIKKFPNMYKFWNNDINKFVLLLRKGVYSYEYIDSWERFHETTLPNKKSFLQ